MPCTRSYFFFQTQSLSIPALHCFQGSLECWYFQKLQTSTENVVKGQKAASILAHKWKHRDVQHLEDTLIVA